MLRGSRRSYGNVLVSRKNVSRKKINRGQGSCGRRLSLTQLILDQNRHSKCEKRGEATKAGHIPEKQSSWRRQMRDRCLSADMEGPHGRLFAFLSLLEVERGALAPPISPTGASWGGERFTLRKAVHAGGQGGRILVIGRPCPAAPLPVSANLTPDHWQLTPGLPALPHRR
jgi:hypothetical protein